MNQKQIELENTQYALDWLIQQIPYNKVEESKKYVKVLQDYVNKKKGK